MLRLILLLIVIILVLSFFGISLQSVITSPTAHANFTYAWQLVVNGWNLIVQFFMSSMNNLIGHTSKST